MRLTTFLLAMFGMSCAAFAQASQQPTISIESKNPAVKSGQPIRIHIVLKNTTDREFTVFRSTGGGSGELYYSVSVIGPDGKSVAATEYGAAIEKNRHQIVPLSRKMVTVPPGASVDDNIDTIKIFKMSAMGTYVVQVSRPNPLDPDIILKSNTLTINVENR